MLSKYSPPGGFSVLRKLTDSCSVGGNTYMRRIQDIMWQSQEAGVTRCKGQLKGTPAAEVGQCEYQKEYWHIKFIKTKGV